MERRIVIRAFGAELRIFDESKGTAVFLQKVDEMVAKTPNSYFLKQFDNPANPKVKYIYIFFLGYPEKGIIDFSCR